MVLQFAILCVGAQEEQDESSRQRAAPPAAGVSRGGSDKSQQTARDPAQLSGDAEPVLNEPAPSAPRLLAEPFQEPRQFLQLLNIGESDFDAFVDGQPITSVDEETLAKILYRMPQIGLDDIERWQKSTVPWESLQSAPGRSRSEFFVLHGRARHIARASLLPELAALFDFAYYYQVRIELAHPSRHVVVYTRSIPQNWHDQAKLDERVSAAAMFLKIGTTEDGAEAMAFAAPRVAWLPDREHPDQGIGPDQILLGNLGMDVGLFDAVRSRNRLPIGAVERECFYALLAAADRAAPATVADHARPLQLGALLQQPERQHGHVIRARGSLRRITKIAVGEPDIQQRFGIRHYYQLDVLIPLDDQAVEVRGAKGEPSGPVYRDSFPFTYCTLRLPAEFEPLVGESQISRPVAMDGFFFKLWAYHTPYVSKFDARQLQLSPMFIAVEPTDQQRAPESGGRYALLAGIAFLLLLAVVWFTVWAMNRSDRNYSQNVLQERFKRGGQVDFDHLDTPD